MKEKIKIILYCLLISFFFLLVTTKSSPLYPMNDWGDANAFFTMGKGLMNGLVPFRDLFEQKGPLLYVIYGIGYLISNMTFFGVFLMEVIFFSVLLYYFYKVLKLYNRENLFYFLSPILCFLILSMSAFSHGGSAEEFSLPLVMISLYHFLFLIKNDNYLHPNRKLYILTGVVAGIVLWLKYTFLGLWIAFGIIFCWLFLKKKRYKQLFSFCGYYLLGMAIATIPVVIYFTYHHALKELWDVYFYFNMFIYPSTMYKISFFAKLWLRIYGFAYNLLVNPIFTFFFLWGLYFIYKDDKVLVKNSKRFVFILFICFYYFIYFAGTNYSYYFLILVPFCIFGILQVGNFLTDSWNCKFKFSSMITCLFFFLMTLFFSSNLSFSMVKKNELAQFKFSEIMNQEKNPTMLYYGGIDAGFYTISGILPSEKYFEKVNVSNTVYPENIDSQNLVIQNKKVQFIVLRMECKEELSIEVPYLEENYELITTHTQEYENRMWKYVLYKRKQNV